jgi:hypothetical protein
MYALFVKVNDEEWQFVGHLDPNINLENIVPGVEEGDQVRFWAVKPVTRDGGMWIELPPGK